MFCRHSPHDAMQVLSENLKITHIQIKIEFISYWFLLITSLKLRETVDFYTKIVLSAHNVFS